MANKRIPELDPVVTAAQTDKFIVRQSGDVEDKHVDMDVMQLALLITESQITDLQSYLLVEANDLTAAVVWDDIPDANVPESAVTQHEAALTITESQISDLQAYLLTEANDLTAAVVWDDIPDVNVPESAVTQHEAALTITESQISDLAHTIGVSGLGIWKYRTETTAPPATGQIRFNNANISLATEFYLHETNEGGVDVSTFLELLLQDGSALFIQDQTDAANFVMIEISSSTDNGVYRTFGIQSVIEEGTEPGQNDDVILITTGLASAGGVTEVNDLTASVTWDDIPDVNVPESAVTQHEAALTITESQISDLQSYLLAELNDLTAAVVWANVPDLNITESSVTQHEAALTITESQISDLGHTSEINDLTASVTWDNIPDVNVPESAVTQHEAALTITESQISDLQSYLLDITGEELADLSDVVSATNTNRFALLANGTTGYVGRALVEADISDLQAYLTSFTETNDLTAAVVWANVPDGNITESSVTQHEAAIDHDALTNFLASEHFTQAAISITESQISDLGAYLENIVEDTTPQLGADLDTNGFDIANLDTTSLDLSITAGSDASGIGGTLTLRAGASGASGAKGGSVVIEATNGAGGGAEGGDISLLCGNASGSGDDGGDFLAMGGNGTGGGGDGGTATIEAGRSVGGGIGGIAAVVGGVGGNGANTGGIGRVIGGVGGDNGGDGGDAEVTGGAGVSAASDGDGGDAVITGGAGAGAGVDGDVVLAVVGATNILFDHATGRLEQGAETYAYQSELAGAEANDLTAAVVWDDIPDANVPESAVTQHEAALTILESQITDGTIFGRIASAETLTNTWGWVDNTGIQFGTGNDWSFLFNGADLQLLCTPTTSAFSIFQGANIKWELDHDADRMWLRDGYTFRISSSDDTDFAEFSHDLTDFLTAFTTTVDWNITGLSGRILQGAETLAFVSEIPTVVVNDVVQARRTTDLILTTSYVDVTLDTTDVESDDTEIEHDAVTDRIVAKTTGLYKIGWEVDVENSISSGSVLITADGRVRVNDTGVEVPGSIAQQGSFRDTSLDSENFNCHVGTTFYVNLTANDFVTLQLRKTEIPGGDSGQFEAVRTILTVERVQ